MESREARMLHRRRSKESANAEAESKQRQPQEQQGREEPEPWRRRGQGGAVNGLRAQASADAGESGGDSRGKRKRQEAGEGTTQRGEATDGRGRRQLGSTGVRRREERRAPQQEEEARRWRRKLPGAVSVYSNGDSTKRNRCCRNCTVLYL